MQVIRPIIHASRTALSTPKSVGIFVVAAAVLFFLFISLPVITTPGNDYLFQWKIMGTPTIVLLMVLSLLESLLLVMHLHIRKTVKAIGAKEAVGGTGLLAGSFASVISCASCYSSLLALFGLGGVTFIMTYRWWIAGGTLALALMALYHTAKRIESGCSVCSIR